MIEILSNDCFMIGAFIWSALMTALIAGSFKFLIKKSRETPKYEIRIISCGQDWLKKNMEEAQEEGWELAGPIVFSNNNNRYHVVAPLKRLL